MNRGLLLLPIAVVFTSDTVLAEDWIGLSGNYYKERSTRVIEPILTLKKELPYQTTVEVSYLVDQITSASGGYTLTDEPFSEVRHDLRVTASKTLFGLVTPGLKAQYSTEPDYESLTVGGDLRFDLFDKNTVLRAYAEFQTDGVGFRPDPTFSDSLETVLFGFGVTQVLRKDLVVGLVGELSRLEGLQENLYRANDVHPRQRRRHSLSAWASYRFRPTGTTVRASYRFYGDSWDLFAHTAEFALAQDITPWLEIRPKFRYYTQDDVYFVRFTEDTDVTLVTSEPKLRAFGSRLYGLQLSWKQSWLGGTFLGAFSESRVEPYYAYLDQDNQFGPAHIAQLNWYWPF